MKKLSICALLLSFLTLTAVFAYTDDDFVTIEKGNLTQIFFKKDPIYLAEQFKNLSYEEQLAIISSDKKEVLPVYYMAFADSYLEKTKDAEGAVKYFILGKLMALEDIKMCKSDVVPEQKLYYPMLSPKTDGIIYNMKREEYKKFVLEAIKYEKRHTKERPNPVWACYHEVIPGRGEPEMQPMWKYGRVKANYRSKLKFMFKYMTKRYYNNNK